MRTQIFEIDYALGKQSELDSLKDLEKLFDCKLKPSENQYSNFDYYGDNIYVELKTRTNIVYKDNKFYYKSRKGNESILETLYFDSPKLQFAKKHNDGNNIFYIVWKCKNCYAYYKINFNEDDCEYFIKHDFNDYGHGYKQHRNIVNVFTDKVNTSFKN